MEREKLSFSFAHFGPDAPWQIKFEHEIMIRQRFMSISFKNTFTKQSIKLDRADFVK